MACFRTRLHTLAEERIDLLDLVARLNRGSCVENSAGSRFTTAFLAEFDQAARTLRYVNAGHNPPLLRRRATGEIERLEAGGLPLCAFRQASYDGATLAVSPGDFLLIYTDGVVEAANEREEEYGLERLTALVQREATDSAACIRGLMASIEAFTAGTRQSDDITCLAVRFTGDDGAASQT